MVLYCAFKNNTKELILESKQINTEDNLKLEANWERRFWLLSGLLVFLRLFLSVYLDLTPDEGYYWELSRRLDYSYFDHPPMVAYVIAFFRMLFGETNLAIRLPSVLGLFVVSWTLFAIAKEHFKSTEVGFWSAFLLNFTPAGMALGFITTPDTPLAVAWGIGAWAFLKAINDEKVKWWLIVGLALGFGALAKYNMIFFVPGVAIAILAFPKYRGLVATKRYWVMVILAALGTIPILYWNHCHDWISFKFQFDHGFKPSSRGLLKNVGEFLGGQLGTIGLTLFPVLWWQTFLSIKRSWQEKDEKRLFLAWVAFPMMAFFVYTGLKSKVEANWPQIAYITAMIFVAEYIRGNSRRIKWVAGPSAFLAILVILQSLSFVLPLPPKADISRRLHGWTQMGQILQKVDIETERKACFVGQGAPLAALLGFYGKLPPERVAEIHKGGNFRFWWKDRSLPKGSDIVYVDTNNNSEAKNFARFFESSASSTHELKYLGKTVKTINITIMKNSKAEFQFK